MNTKMANSEENNYVMLQNMGRYDFLKYNLNVYDQFKFEDFPGIKKNVNSRRT
jgi:hypothetical protein